MSKKLPLLILALLIAALTVLWPRIFAPPTTAIPYRFRPESKLLGPRQIALAKEAKLLVIGDRHGRYFARYLPLLPKVKMLNLAADHHGIHRSLQKLRELPQLPPVVLFLGGYDEFFEQKFLLRYYHAIKKNLQAFQDDLKLSLMATLPWSQRLLTSPPPLYWHGKKIIPATKQTDPKKQQRELELRFKLYEFEVQYLIELVTKQKSKLILVTAPVNLKNPPYELCSNASTPSLERKLASIEEHLRRGESKLAIAELSPLKGVVLGHARFHYLLGKAYYRQGEYQPAKRHLIRANSFDCAPQGSSHILNNILRQKARENGIPLLDLDQMANAHFKRRKEIFNRGDHSNYLKDEHYQRLVQQFTGLIRHSLR